MKSLPENDSSDHDNNPSQPDTTSNDSPSQKRSRWPVVIVLLLLVLIGAGGYGGYLGWLWFKDYDQQQQDRLADLQTQLSISVSKAELDQKLNPLTRSVGRSDERIGHNQQGIEQLTQSTEKLFELYGRDENSWKLSEVEYLLSVAQHKLILENDFEGAAKTLEAASDRLAELADPGMLPVRVQISEEIASLKTRARPDLVGMTLLVARLTQQISHLTAGYQTQVKTDITPAPAAAVTDNSEQPIEQRIRHFVTSLVTIKTGSRETEKTLQANAIDVKATLEDQLKLTRWALLDRDAVQFKKLMDGNVELFKAYFDLDDAANADFYQSLITLQKTSIRPELPDISGSLRLLKQIQHQKDNAPEPEVNNG